MIKKIFPIIYIMWSCVLMLFALVSAFSYFAVLHRFGIVPGNDSLYNLAESTGNSIPALTPDIGILFIYFYICSIFLVPLVMIVNAGVYKIDTRFGLPWKHCLLVIGVWLMVYFLMYVTEFQGWYMQYVLD